MTVCRIAGVLMRLGKYECSWVRGTEFCAVCPDAAGIPEGCQQNCGWPFGIDYTGGLHRRAINDKCQHQGRCVCCQDSPDRWALWEAYLARRIRDNGIARQETQKRAEYASQAVDWGMRWR